MIADATVPTTSAPYEPENTTVKSASKHKSRVASAVLPLSYFHLIAIMLNDTAKPMIRNSIDYPL